MGNNYYMNNLDVWCGLCQHGQGKGKPLHTSCVLAQERAEVLQELFSVSPDKPEKALPSAQVRLNTVTAIWLLQRPGVFPTDSACFRASGSPKLETTA